MSVLSTRIRLRREELGMSQEEVAEYIRKTVEQAS